MTLKWDWPVWSTGVITVFTLIIISDGVKAFPRWGKYVNQQEIKEVEVQERRGEESLRLSHYEQ